MASYYVWSAAVGTGTGATWANAYTNLTAALAGKLAGDVFFLAHDHAETTAAAITLLSAGTAANPAKVICVDRAGSVPPVSADRRATAQITTTGASNITINGAMTHYDGVIFNAGTGAVAASILISQVTANATRFDNCSLRILATGAGNIANGTNAVPAHT